MSFPSSASLATIAIADGGDKMERRSSIIFIFTAVYDVICCEYMKGNIEYKKQQ